MRHSPKPPLGPYVMVSVTDNGTGMDQETQARIFEPFFTTKEQGKGTGLGLATVYGIVKQSQGFIWVYSEPGKGTTFKIYLPRVTGKPGKATLPPLREAPVGGPETILLVEDEVALQEATAEYLKARGYSVLKARNGAEALELCEQHRSRIQLLLTDLVMPVMAGPELASALLEQLPDLKIIYMSGYTDRTVDERMLGPNAVFLQKPFSLDVLARRIRQLVER